MARFASRDLSFVSLSEVMRGPGGTTQQCAKAGNETACTCCTNNTANKMFEADASDLPALHAQLQAAH
jgi:hypothetical protein